MQSHQRLHFLITQLLEQNPNPKFVTLAVGELVPLTDEEISKQWSMFVDGTNLVQTTLNIDRVEAELQCMACFEKYHPKDQKTLCPICGGVGAKVISGEEFKIEAIDE